MLGIATNFGANPVFDAQVVSKIPTLAREKLLSPAGVTYVVNFGIMVFGIYVAFRLFAASFRWRKNKRVDNPSLVSILLIWSSFASIGAFIVTDHYYVVDARYLAIVLFAVSVAATTYLRDKIPLSNKKMLWLIIVLTTSILFGFVSLFQTRNADSLALSDVEGRNELIAQALAKHRVDALVGDYWRVMPIKLETHGSVQILPLDSCIAPRKILSSSNWQVPLSQHSFAYILSLDASLTNYSKCTLDQIIAEYGQPNQSVLIGGSLNKPKEFVLFYDNGAQKSTLQPRTPQDKTSTVLPIALTDLLNTDCPDSITVMNIVAHQDDDLLFMNPDLEHNIMAGNCVRTVYVTAGDAGRPTQYWQAREAASEAAYNSLLGINNIWVHRIVKISDTEFLTVANPKDNYKISLIFMLLPDGNISGQGFRVTNHESLASLKAHRITLIHSVDKQSVYSSDGLVSALAEIMKTYKPSELHIQAPQNDGKFTADHSDHKSVGSYTDHAMKLYVSNHAVTTRYYVGYSGREWPQNVFGEDLSKKTNAFLEYAKHDNAVCQTLEECKKLRSYGSYLPRQYSFPR